jgi:DNA end-binding protein Ku
MAARSIASATVSFGLVTVPVRLYPATSYSAGMSFHLLHSKDGMRLKQQYICPADDEVVPRSEMIKGYEYAKDQYVTFTPEELKALDERATQGIEITEFVPLQAVDPVYYEKAYYLGPDKGGDRPYALLSAAMEEMKLAAVARYAARGKDYLVLLRAHDQRLVMQQLYHSDEVRPMAEVPAAERAVREAELKLAKQLISQITSERFAPEKYEDEVRARIRKAVEEKVKGREIQPPEARKPAGQVIDLMEALKASLGTAGAARAAAKRAKPAARRSEPTRRPPRRATSRRAS